MPGMKVNIIRVSQVRSGDPARFGRFDTLIQYGIEGEGTDIFTIPNGEPTQEELEAAVRARVASRHPSHGTSFEV